MPKPLIDLTGRVFSRLTALCRDGAHPVTGEAVWLCMCECGNEVRRRSSHLRRAGVAHQSCGCVPPVPLDDLAGKRFGRWRVVRRADSRVPPGGGKAKTYYLCRCECGVEREVIATSLTGGLSLSCGCGRRKKRRK